MTRTLLNESKTPEYLWAKAVTTASYIINRVYLRPLTSKTSYELFRGRKPNVSYFHAFGSKCYVLKNNLNIGKFDERFKECLFVGYSLNSRVFRVFNLKSRVIEESINVKFIENFENDDIDDDVGEELTKQGNNSFQKY